MDERARRIGNNEVLFREVNTQIRHLDESFPGLRRPEYRDFVCECGRADCAELIRLTLEEYAHVRARSDQFAIVPGHEFPDVETVQEENERFSLITKDEGGPAEYARSHPPEA